MTHFRWWLILLAAGLVATALRAEEIGWQEAVARLLQERGQAELCARALKKYGTKGEIARGEVAYGEAKADYDGMIGGLMTALAGGQRPASLPDLDTRLKRGFEEREAFCAVAKSRLPPLKPGEKGIAEEIVKGAVEPVVEAIAKLVDEAIHGPPGRRETIKTQLEGATWPPFASISPLS
jgi:hypothetical protein